MSADVRPVSPYKAEVAGSRPAAPTTNAHDSVDWRHAADVFIGAMTAPAVVRTFVHGCGWSYDDWANETLRVLVLKPT